MTRAEFNERFAVIFNMTAGVLEMFHDQAPSIERIDDGSVIAMIRIVDGMADVFESMADQLRQLARDAERT